jgi:hypothetical protein
MDPDEGALKKLWDRPGLSWELRTMLAPGLKDFKDDPGKAKTKNLETLLARLTPESREHIETLSMKKPSAFYDKVVSALGAERDLIASMSTVKREPDSDFDAIAAGFEEPAVAAPTPLDDEMDLDGYSVPAEKSLYEVESSFVDQLLRGISRTQK